MFEWKEPPYYSRPSDPGHLLERRFHAQWKKGRELLDEIDEWNKQQSLEALHRCEILELKSKIFWLRRDLEEARGER